MALAENLKYLRKRKGLTQKELSDLSGVSCNSIINYENSRRTSPPISVLQKLARALGTSVDVLTMGHIANFSDGKQEIYVHESELAVDGRELLEKMIGKEEANRHYIADAISDMLPLLNTTGLIEAVKRVSELVELQQYRITVPQGIEFNSRKFLDKIYKSYFSKQEVNPCPEDAPQTAAEHNPGSDQTDAGK